jgi:7,8-dihydropterin-6-yl-methyl-4-(beta-D-ribofuranosyl)aminobenzene 5'-phosphate synthase
MPRRYFMGVSDERPDGWMDVGINQASRLGLDKWPRRFSRAPLWLRDNIVFLGEIPQKYPQLAVHVGETPSGPGGTFEPDRLADDTALAYVTPQGLIIVAGCSHSGVVNIIEQAKAVTGVSKIHSLFGGLHFRDMAPAAIEQSIDYLRQLELAQVWAAHCTEHDLAGLPHQLELKTGQTHRIDF